MVLFAHASLMSGQVQARGDGTVAGNLVGDLAAGLILFFALSGYLIAGPFLRALADGRALPSGRAYLLRRAARILPAYWVGLAAMLLITRPARLTLWSGLVHALLLQNVVPGQATAFYFVAWTLGIEALFYLFVPVGAMLVARAYRGRALPVSHLALMVLGAWAFSALFSAIAAWALPTPTPLAGPLRLGLPAMLGQFCPGMLLVVALHAEAQGGDGRVLRAYRALVSRPRLVLAAVALLAVVAQVQSTAQSSVVADAHKVVIAVAAGLALVLVVNAGRWADRVAAVLAPLGTVSYGVYLWHWVVITWLRAHHRVPGFGPGLRPLAKDIVVVAAGALLVATVSWFVVERPMIRWAARRAGRIRPAVPTAVAAEPAAELASA